MGNLIAYTRIDKTFLLEKSQILKKDAMHLKT